MGAGKWDLVRAVSFRAPPWPITDKLPGAFDACRPRSFGDSDADSQTITKPSRPAVARSSSAFVSRLTIPPQAVLGRLGSVEKLKRPATVSASWCRSEGASKTPAKTPPPPPLSPPRRRHVSEADARRRNRASDPTVSTIYDPAAALTLRYGR